MNKEPMEPLRELEYNPWTKAINSLTHAGFDYAKTILMLRKYMSYEKIAYYMGYGGTKVGSVQNIVRKNSVPEHDKGEMLYALYVRIFDKKPPMSDNQKAGLEDDGFLQSIRENVKKGIRL